MSKHLESYVTAQCSLNQSYLKAHLAYITKLLRKPTESISSMSPRTDSQNTTILGILIKIGFDFFLEDA